MQAIMSSFPKMCSKRSLKGLSWQLTNILGLGVPSGGGVGVGLACRSVGDMIWCTVGMKVTKTYHFHENNKYTMYSSFLFENWITYIEEHYFSHSQYNSNRKEWLCFLIWGEKDAVKIWEEVALWAVNMLGLSRQTQFFCCCCYNTNWPVYNVS